MSKREFSFIEAIGLVGVNLFFSIIFIILSPLFGCIHVGGSLNLLDITCSNDTPKFIYFLVDLFINFFHSFESLFYVFNDIEFFEYLFAFLYIIFIFIFIPIGQIFFPIRAFINVINVYKNDQINMEVKNIILVITDIIITGSCLFLIVPWFFMEMLPNLI